MKRWLAFLLAPLAAALWIAGSPSKSADRQEVDLALVLAVDISNSMDPEEQALQREGFVEAFRGAEIHDAIRKGTLGKIAVVYMEWAGTATQHVLVPWTVIESSADAQAFADRLAAGPIRRAPRTSVAAAIDTSMMLLDGSNVEPIRQVIDISGDGANNQGRLVTQARDEALARGVTINGLPIMLKRGGSWDIEHLDAYYRDCVIGGPGAFIIPIRERRHFAEAIRTKLVREIAALPGEPFVQLAQAGPRANCLSGEIQSDRWWRN